MTCVKGVWARFSCSMIKPQVFQLFKMSTLGELSISYSIKFHEDFILIGYFSCCFSDCATGCSKTVSFSLKGTEMHVIAQICACYISSRTATWLRAKDLWRRADIQTACGNSDGLADSLHPST